MFFRETIAFPSLKINIVLANSADSDKILHYVAFHLGRHCLPKYVLRVFQSTRGKSSYYSFCQIQTTLILLLQIYCEKFLHVISVEPVNISDALT